MEVIFELTRLGATTKVVAIDPETGTEVTIQGPSGMTEAALKRNALNKLHYVLKKKEKDGQSGDSGLYV
ncbi:MAG: hypothetical protein FWF24_03190 [Alphaproteobacteria bacterium]|nr:hypothetical protein [Alphaproteobacteria bacterium]